MSDKYKHLGVPKEYEVPSLTPTIFTEPRDVTGTDTALFNAFMALFSQATDRERTELVVMTVAPTLDDWGFSDDDCGAAQLPMHEHYVRTSPYVVELKRRLEEANRVIAVLEKRSIRRGNILKNLGRST